MTAITLILLTGAICNGQERHRYMTGIDLSSIIRERVIGLYSGISVGGRWSVCSATFARIPIRCIDESTQIHREDLLLGNPDEEDEKSKDLIAAQICAQYWTRNMFEGPVISFGLMTSNSRNIEFPLSAGYSCGIWKGLRVSVFYNVHLLETILDSQFRGKGLCVGLGYEF